MNWWKKQISLELPHNFWKSHFVISFGKCQLRPFLDDGNIYYSLRRNSKSMELIRFDQKDARELVIWTNFLLSSLDKFGTSNLKIDSFPTSTRDVRFWDYGLSFISESGKLRSKLCRRENKLDYSLCLNIPCNDSWGGPILIMNAAEAKFILNAIQMYEQLFKHY